MDKNFIKELESLINKHSLENDSDTPDYMLSKVMTSALSCFVETVNERDAWYGRNKSMELDGVMLINRERINQIVKHNYDHHHDSGHEEEELLLAAAAYLMSDVTDKQRESVWPWDPKTFQPTPHDRIKELQKAGALIAAEIDRLIHKTPNL